MVNKCGECLLFQGLSKKCRAGRNTGTTSAACTSSFKEPAKLFSSKQCGGCRFGVPLFIFNYLDYKLWEKYAYELRGKDIQKGGKQRENFFAALGCGDFEEV